jgi:hypothetical protein
MAKAKSDNNTPGEGASKHVELASFVSRELIGSPTAIPNDVAILGPPDPILDAIERHRSAKERYLAGIHAELADKAIDPLQQEEWDALVDLVKITPTTIRGAAEALSYVETYANEQDDGCSLFENYNRVAEPARTFLSRIAAMLSAGPEQSQSPPIALDAALLALGCEHDRLEQKYRAADEKCRPLYEELKQRHKQWTTETPKHTNQDSTAARDRFADEIGITAIEERGEHTDDIINEMDPIARAIMAIPANTFAGLAVKAKVAAFNASDYWDETDEDCDWDKLCIRNLIDSVFRAAGVSRIASVPEATVAMTPLGGVTETFIPVNLPVDEAIELHQTALREHRPPVIAHNALLAVMLARTPSEAESAKLLRYLETTTPDQWPSRMNLSPATVHSDAIAGAARSLASFRS